MSVSATPLSGVDDAEELADGLSGSGGGEDVEEHGDDDDDDLEKLEDDPELAAYLQVWHAIMSGMIASCLDVCGCVCRKGGGMLPTIYKSSTGSSPLSVTPW